MNTNNSISNSLKKLLEINSNSLKTFERINEAITTDQKDVPLEILTDEGSKTVYVPSFGYMKRELERLDTNLKSLSGLGKGNTRIKLPDGTYQNIITSTLKTPANDITSFNRPINFSTKPNYFFEDFLNPILTTSINVSGQIPNNTERILVKRIVFNSSNVSQSEKARYPIVSTEFPITTFFNTSHCLKALSPILTTELGISTSSNLQ